ncbi:hypothetical protein SLA2020_431140 [Shorea laevis]
MIKPNPMGSLIAQKAQALDPSNTTHPAQFTDFLSQWTDPSHWPGLNPHLLSSLILRHTTYHPGHHPKLLTIQPTAPRKKPYHHLSLTRFHPYARHLPLLSFTLPPLLSPSSPLLLRLPIPSLSPDIQSEINPRKRVVFMEEDAPLAFLLKQRKLRHSSMDSSYQMNLAAVSLNALKSSLPPLSPDK